MSGRTCIRKSVVCPTRTSKKKDAVVKKWKEWWEKNKNNKDYE